MTRDEKVLQILAQIEFRLRTIPHGDLDEYSGIVRDVLFEVVKARYLLLSEEAE